GVADEGGRHSADGVVHRHACTAGARRSAAHRGLRRRPYHHALMSWPDPVERVAEYLRTSGAEARLEEFVGGTPTAAAAAEAAGCGLDQIVKSLVFVCDDRPVVALVPGDRRGDPAKIARAADGTTARIATAREVTDATGFPPGGVAPFPLPGDCRVLIEQ